PQGLLPRRRRDRLRADDRLILRAARVGAELRAAAARPLVEDLRDADLHHLLPARAHHEAGEHPAADAGEAAVLEADLRGGATADGLELPRDGHHLAVVVADPRVRELALALARDDLALNVAAPAGLRLRAQDELRTDTRF